MHPSIRYNPLAMAAANHALRLTNRGTTFVFVATTGRSGSAALASVFQAVRDVASFHEPWPAMTDDVPDGEDRSAYFARLFRNDKRFLVRRAAHGHRCYLETNHQFVKRFADLAVAEFGRALRIIHLVRDPVSVARSFHRIDSIPGRTERGRRWLLVPEDPQNLLPMVDLLRDGGALPHDLHRCLWYWYETEARIKALKARTPGIVWKDLRTEDLNDRERVINLFEGLGLDYDHRRLDDLVGVRRNLKRHYGEERVPAEQAEAMHDELRAALAERFGEDALA